MKKSFLFGLLAIGLVGACFGGISFADTSIAQWDYIHDETSWNNSFTDGVLKLYYQTYPLEDLWSTTTNSSEPGFNDKIYTVDLYLNTGCIGDEYEEKQYKAEWYSDNGVQKIIDTTDPTIEYYIPTFYFDIPETPFELFGGASGGYVATPDDLVYPASRCIKVKSISYGENVSQSWSGAVYAPGAKYPWAAIELPIPFTGTIKFSYEGKDDAYPWGETVKLFNGGFAIASLPEEFKDNTFLLPENASSENDTWNGSVGVASSFDQSKLVVTLIPAHTLTIHYVYSNGGEAATDYTGIFLDGEEYNQASPEIVNYVVDIVTVSGTIAEDVEITVTYTPSSSSNKSSGGGGGGSSKTSTSDETKATTGDNAKLDEIKADDETKLDENGEENANEEENKDDEKVAPMTESQAVEKFGQEQIDAYKWALENGITTMKTVEDARLDEPLTRAELAKMMVVYIQKVLGKSPVVTGDVNYSDVKVEEIGDLVDYVKLAYQYQIMGINADGTPIEYFNPHGIVSRGEYATVFSRVLFGAKFNKDGEDFYTNHLEALKTAEILTNTTPSIQEMRGWVMLMMYRSSQNGEAIEKVATATEESKDEVKTDETANKETVTSEAKTETNEETKAEETTNAESTTGDAAETPAVEEKSETTVENTETTAESTTGDVAEVNAGAVAEVATGDTASN